MNIQIASYNNKFSSYSIISERIGKAIEKLGYGVNFREVNDKDPKSIKLDWLSSKVNSCKPDEELLILPIYFGSRECKDKYLYTMYESTEMAKDIAVKLSSCKALLTPSMFSGTVLSANGCKCKIFICPLGCYTEDKEENVFEYKKIDSLDLFTFLIVYNPMHGIQRKGIFQVVKCFLEAFKNNNNVRLIIKTLPLNTKLEITEDPRIVYINKYMSDNEMYNLFCKCHCYINIATGGYELVPLEMLRCGRMLISHKYGGVAEYVNNNNTVLLDDYYIDNANEVWKGGWAYVRDEDLIQKMQYVYNNKYILAEKSLERSESVKDFSWEYCASKIMKAITNKTPTIYIKSNPYPLTVVITTANDRVDRAIKAYQSAISNGFTNIVISGSNISKQDQNKLKSIVSPNTKLSIINYELGRNESWLRGVSCVETEYAMILHDDDLIINNIADLLEPLNKKVNLCVWNAKKHDDEKDLGDATIFDFNKNGYNSIETIYQILLKPDAFSISPVNAFFKTKDLINVLNEYQTVLRKRKELYCFNLESGNDLLIWLRIADLYKNLFYINKPMVSYGHWENSTTLKDVSVNKTPQHIKIYNFIRDYYLYGKLEHNIKNNYYFVFNDFVPAGRQDIYNCINTWKKYSIKNNNRIKFCPVKMSQVQKRYMDIDLPFVNEIIDVAISEYNLNSKDIIILSNNDVYPVDSFINHLDLHYFTKGDIPFYLFRRDCKQLVKPYEKYIRLNTTIYPGRDTFVFTVDWWLKNKNEYPEMLYGGEFWDYIFSKLIEIHNGCHYQYLIYHLNHKIAGNRNNERVYKYNYQMAKKFLDWFDMPYKPEDLTAEDKLLYPKL